VLISDAGIRRAEIAERLEISEASICRIMLREGRKARLVPPAPGTSGGTRPDVR
jgi:DNA-binding transcriptional regulator LsrR (DeoR family)